MRKGRDTEVIYHEDKLVGINLGADFVSEHEWGIDGIRGILGIEGNMVKASLNSDRISKVKEALSRAKTETPGYFRRKMSKLPEGFAKLYDNLDTKGIKLEEGTFWFLSLYSSYSAAPNEDFWKRVLGYPSGKLQTAWNDSSFFFATQNKELIERFKKAFEEKDIAMFLGGGGPFQNAGLKIFIYSETFDLLNPQFEKADNDVLELYSKAIETGIYEKLEAAGKKYFALSPRLYEDGVKFWLNPYDQHLYDSGYYTVKDLEEWIENKGKIIKQKQNYANQRR